MTLFHLLPRDDWEAAPADQPFAPPSLAAEGFIHAAAGERQLLGVANALYKHQPGEFVALEIDASRLSSEVRWEPPTPALPPEVEASDAAEGAPKFPHIYGAINRDAIVRVWRLVRDVDGSFLGLAALSTDNPLGLKTPSELADELLRATDAFAEALKRVKDRLEGRLSSLDDEISKGLS